LHAQQAATIAAVGQRQQPEQGQHAAGLGGGNHSAGHRALHREGLRQAFQQRLCVIDIGHADTRRDGHQAQQGARKEGRGHVCGCILKLDAPYRRWF
jgi:hypothetical protein